MLRSAGIKNRWMLSALCALALAAVSVSAAAADYKLSTLGPGTSVYVVMTTFANIVNEKVPNARIQVNATGVATRHTAETAMGRNDFAMASPSMIPLMQKGVGPYKRLPHSRELVKNLRLVMNFPLGYYHVVTHADSGITSLQDIKGKKVFLGPPGGAARRIAQRFVTAVTGYEPNKDFDSVDLGWDAASQSFQDGHIDVYINPTLPPSPVITQIAMLQPIRLLSLPDNMDDNPALQKLIHRPGGKIGIIAADTYGSGEVNKKEVRAIASIGGIVTNKDVPEDVVYRATKAFWENLSSRAGSTPILKNLHLANALEEANLPLHPGALRYYREAGLDIPKDLIPK